MHNAIPKLGTPWPEQGGTLCCLMRGEDGAPDYYLIAADKTADLAWGSYGHDIAAADSKNDGLKNTDAILAAGMDHPAAQFAASLIVGDHADFYLPAINELAAMRATCPELFEDGWNWSSTQFSSSHAWCQHFANGYQHIGTKSEVLAVRAARRYYPLSDSTI